MAWGHSSKCLLKHCLLGKNYPLIRANKIGVLFLLSLLAEQAGCSVLRLNKAGLVHLSRPSSISASQHKPQRSLGRDRVGYTPLIHTDALHLSRAAACWPGWPVQPPWQGDKAPHTRGANCTGHVLTARHVPWSRAQRCRTGPSCELTRNMAFSVLLWMQKAEAGSVGYLETSNPLIFFYFYWCFGFNFCKLLRSFAKPVCAFSSHWLVLW